LPQHHTSFRPLCPPERRGREAKRDIAFFAAIILL